ncbi:MAG: phytanoyl-CoA dioxygenase family protein, partial [Gammaproteobacteria bacterium]|nr:phytanoyl-CoA dioxygenase family protein [Gammaproteobacteria bacterium]
GCLRIKSVFAADEIRSLHSAFVEKYGTYFENKVFDDALLVGDRRTMITVAVQGPFNSSRLYANRLIVTLMKRLLGQHLTLGSVGAIVSLPGARNQQIHRDIPPIFSEQDNGEGKFVTSALPPYAVTVVIPLVPLDKETGTTRMWPGSHRDSSADNRRGRFYDPYASLGDCLLMDYRLRHQGLANASGTVRAILYLVYCRPWFVDYRNYWKQEPLRVPRHEYERVPLEHRNLFSRTRGGDDRVTPDPAWLKLGRDP